MPVPFLDLKQQYAAIGAEITAGLTEVFENTAYILGPKVRAFEEDFAAFCGIDHCVGMSSGTDAVHAMLAVSGLPRGSGVILPPNTFTATAEGVVMAGLVPVFADVDRGTWNLSPRAVEAFLEENSRGGRSVDPRSGAAVSAILPVDLYGRPAELAEFENIADRFGLLLFEDACQSHGASRGGRMTGSFGSAAAFSFYPGKNLGAWGEGGAVTTRSGEMAERLRSFRDHGSSRKYFYSQIGHNYRMEAIQGAVLGVKLRYLPDWNRRRAEAAARYGELLAGCPVELPPAEEGVVHSWHLYAIHTEARKELGEYLASKGIGSGLHYPYPLHLQEAYADLGYGEGDFPVSELNSSRNITLPMFPEITPGQQEEVASAVAGFFG